MNLARALIAAGAETPARDLLKSLAARHAGFRQPQRWLDALAAPRLGSVALLSGGRTNPADAPPQERARKPAMALDGMERLTVFVATAADDFAHRAAFELLGGSSLPSVAPLVVNGTTDDGRAWFAVPKLGRELPALLRGRPAIERSAARAVCAEVAALLTMLAGLGVALPDADAQRFEVTESGRLWLVDVVGIERRTPADAAALHGRYIQALCRHVLATLRSGDELLQGLIEAEPSLELARRLDAHRR